MQGTRVSPFSQYTNWFRLGINDGKLYKIPVLMTDEEPGDYFLKHDGEYYSLDYSEGYEGVDPQGMLRLRVILHGFRNALRSKGFDFKGAHKYIAYWAKHPYRQPHNDIFSAYTGFEYRIVEYENDENFNYYLVIDPHVVFIMKISIDGLISRGINPSNLTDLPVRVLSNEDERFSGIDGLLVEILAQEKEVLCQLIDVRTGTKESIKASQIYLEPRPEIIRSVLQKLGSNFDVVKFQREKSFLESPIASKERLNKTQEIINTVAD